MTLDDIEYAKFWKELSVYALREAEKARSNLNNLMMTIPNILHESAPIGMVG